MPSRRKPTHVPIAVLNRRCKMCILRYMFVLVVSLSAMTYFVPYEVPNTPTRNLYLNESDLTIMSYNVRGSGMDSEATTQWKTRKNVAIEMINIYDPDIIGLQEPKRNQLETFKQIGYASYGKYIATSILYKKDKFKMMDGDTLWLSQTPDIEHSTSWDISQERVITWILIANHTDTSQCQIDDDASECQIQVPDDAYLIFNTHLDHKGEISRMESCVVIKDIIHNISTIKYDNKYPVFLTGDFNAAKYSNIWQCFMDNKYDSFQLKDALHNAHYIGYLTKLQLQYTFHGFVGLQMNTWYMRMGQYMVYGSSHSVVKWFRNILFDGVCCNAPSLYRQVFRRIKYDHKAGIHHLDWILYMDHDKIDEIPFFEVIAYHHMIDIDKRPGLTWSLKGLFYDRVVSKTIYPSDHFPIISSFKLHY